MTQDEAISIAQRMGLKTTRLVYDPGEADMDFRPVLAIEHWDGEDFYRTGVNMPKSSEPSEAAVELALSVCKDWLEERGVNIFAKVRPEPVVSDEMIDALNKRQHAAHTLGDAAVPYFPPLSKQEALSNLARED